MPVRAYTAFIPVTEVEQAAFCHADLKTRPLEQEMRAVGVRWQEVPAKYASLAADELRDRIARAREKLGRRVAILGHHYQRDDVIAFADFRGDSLRLSQMAASASEADFIVFCGVHFMAETARVLCAPHQKIILPNMTAGCSMADMAPTQSVLEAWRDLNGLLAGQGGILPVTYVNSTAEIKALVGRNGGIACTSANALAVLSWAYRRADRVFFIPDQHLGRNSALELGIGLNEMALWDPSKPLGGNAAAALRKSRLVLWQGHCSVHTRFTVRHVEQVRKLCPGVKVIVHPECTMDVVQAADMSGSTEGIIHAIEEAPPGGKWAVGTEINMVNRLAREHPDKEIVCLSPVVYPCTTMYRVHPAYLLWALEGLVEGRVVNEITVDEETARYARTALERMLEAT